MGGQVGHDIPPQQMRPIALFRNYVMPPQNTIRDTFLPEYVSRSAFLPLFSNTTVYHDGRIS